MKLTECNICNKKRKVEEHRRLTQYADDTKNWLTCCKDCIARDNDHYRAMWKDYYESQGFGETFY